MQMIKVIIFMIRCKYLLSKVKKDGMYLRKIKFDDWTLDICLAAVHQNGLVIESISNHKYKFTHDDYEKLCLAAVKQNSAAFEFVAGPTELVCIEAIKQNELVYYQYIHQREYFKFQALKYIITNTSLAISINLDDKSMSNTEVVDLLLSIPEGDDHHVTLKKGRVSTIAKIMRI